MGSATLKSLYDTDFVEWTELTAEMLREGRMDEIDIAHLAAEIEDLGKSDRKAVFSQLRRMLLHMVKQKMQPERDGSRWRSSINNLRAEIRYDVEASPSLCMYLKENLQDIYTQAVIDAIDEMELPASLAAGIPRQCPHSLDELLEGNPEPWG